jgi:type II secretory pathway pseudopilin PulG
MEQTRQERNRRLIFTGAMLASVVIMGLLGLGFWLQSQNATEQAQLRQAAEYQQVTAQAASTAAIEQRNAAQTAATKITQQEEGANFEKRAAETQTNFSLVADPVKRVEYLADLFTMESDFSEQDYDPAATRLFWELTKTDQLALFEVKDPDRLLTLVKGLSANRQRSV